MHVDTGHNFTETLQFRDQCLKKTGEKLIVKYVQDSIDKGTAVEEKGPNASRNGLQTVTLLEGLEEGKYDCTWVEQEEMKKKQELKKDSSLTEMSLDIWDLKNQRPVQWFFNGRKNLRRTLQIFSNI